MARKSEPHRPDIRSAVTALPDAESVETGIHGHAGDHVDINAGLPFMGR